MTYGDALWRLKDGRAVCRTGWNGRGMYLFMIATWDYRDPRHGGRPTLPFIAMKTVDGSVVPWLCSQTDALAEDWQEA